MYKTGNRGHDLKLEKLVLICDFSHIHLNFMTFLSLPKCNAGFIALF